MTQHLIGSRRTFGLTRFRDGIILFANNRLFFDGLTREIPVLTRHSELVKGGAPLALSDAGCRNVATSGSLYGKSL